MNLKDFSENPKCVAAAVSILGDKWCPLLIRALSIETMRFCQLQDEVGGVNPRTLSAKLQHLEAAGVIAKKSYQEIPPKVEYSLTDKGRDLVPILRQMADWSEKYAPETTTAR